MKRISKELFIFDDEDFYFEDSDGSTEFDWETAQEQLEYLIHDLEEIKFETSKRNRPIKIVGDLGLWDGRKRIHPEFEDTWEKAINRCTSGNYDKSVRIEQKGDFTVEVTVRHHDGTNRFRLTCY